MSHFKAFLHVRKGLNELWEQDQLINAVVKTDDGHLFRVHWELLVAVSPFLQRIVEAMPNSPGDNRFLQIPVSNISGSTMSSIISWAYRGTLKISPKKVESLIRAANTLEIPSVVRLCIKFLGSQIDEDTCIAIYKFAKHFQCRELYKQAKNFLLENFENIYPTSFDFLKLELEDLESLIQSDKLNVSDEERTFWAIMRWVEHDVEMRREHLPLLLPYIRFGFCSQAFYNNTVMLHPLLVENVDVQSILYQGTMLFAELNGNAIEVRPIDLQHPLIRPRIPREVIFSIGGWSNGSATNVVETFDIRAGRWFLSSYTDNMPRAYHGLVSMDGVIYMIGGFDGNQCFNTVRCFDPLRHLWYEKSCMYVARCYISVTTTSDKSIYALGGYDGHVRVNTAERYDVNDNQWRMIANMHLIRSDASAASLYDKVYIVGGFNGQQVLSTAEIYDPELDTWTMIPEMSSPRSGVNLTTYNDTIYVIGGFNGSNRLSSVERYDTKLHQWVVVAEMNIPRSNFATACIEDKLFVIGGFNGLTTVSSVEFYSSLTDTWTMASDMNVNRSALSACVMKGMLNGHEYSFLGNSSS